MQNPSFSFAFNETAATKEQILKRVFCDPGDARLPLFEEINFPSNDRTRLMPGAPLLIPHSQNVSIGAKKAAQSVAQSAVRGQAGILTSPASAQFLNEENALLAAMVAGAPGFAKTAADVLTDYMGKRLNYISKDLTALERLYRDAPKSGMKLSSQAFIEKKAKLMSQIDRQMTGFARDHILGKQQTRGLKQTLGFKTTSATVPFELKGNGIQNVNRISEMTRKTQTLSNKVKSASKPLTFLSIGLYGHEVVNAFQSDGVEAGARKASENAGKFAGGKMGAKGGAIVGAKVGAALAFGLGTGGVGFAVLGVAAVTTGIVGGSMAGSWAGGKAAGGLHDGATKLTGFVGSKAAAAGRGSRAGFSAARQKVSSLWSR